MPFVRTEDGVTRWTCPDCGGVAHPANGWVLSPGWVLCGACARRFAGWVHRWTNARGKRGKGHVSAVSFYEAAARRG